MFSASAHLIGEFAYARSDDGLHLEMRHLPRVPRHDVTELQPQRVLGLALQRAEELVVHNLRCFASGLAPVALRSKEKVMFAG